jgi:hypothetical protein
VTTQLGGQRVPAVRTAYVERDPGAAEPLAEQGGRAGVLVLDDQQGCGVGHAWKASRSGTPGPDLPNGRSGRTRMRAWTSSVR